MTSATFNACFDTFDFAAYVPLALRTEAPLPTPVDRLNHALLGLISETGEIGTEIKRIAIYGKSLDDAAKVGGTLRTHIAEEIGDVLWYVAIAADVLQRPDSQERLTRKLPLLGADQGSDAAALIDTTCKLAIANGTIAQVLVGGEASVLDYEPALAGELSDLLRELNYLASRIGIPLQQIADDNIAKLKLRYPDKFSAEAAEARADKGGLDARNS